MIDPVFQLKKVRHGNLTRWIAQNYLVHMSLSTTMELVWHVRALLTLHNYVLPLSVLEAFDQQLLYRYITNFRDTKLVPIDLYSNVLIWLKFCFIKGQIKRIQLVKGCSNKTKYALHSHMEGVQCTSNFALSGATSSLTMHQQNSDSKQKQSPSSSFSFSHSQFSHHTAGYNFAKQITTESPIN